MRGNVYRFGRRRAGSIVLATGAALTLALAGSSAATAKVRASATKAPARSSVVARAAGHKIA